MREMGSTLVKFAKDIEYEVEAGSLRLRSDQIFDRVSYSESYHVVALMSAMVRAGG